MTIPYLQNLKPEDMKTFEKIEILLHINKPIFILYEDTCHRVAIESPEPPVRMEEEVATAKDDLPKQKKVFVARLCKCCGEIVKKHTCEHNLCPKPCADYEKQKKIRSTRQADTKSACKLAVSEGSKESNEGQPVKPAVI